jgi:helix-turn-helix protein
MTIDGNNSRRAAQIFKIEEICLNLPIADKIWRSQSEPVDSFTSVAATHWEFIVTKQMGRTYLTVRGPETRATIVTIPKDAEFFGVQFRIGTFSPALPAAHLVDDGVTLPGAGSRSFWLNGSAWEYPTFDNLDVFVRRLMHKGLVVRNPIAAAALQGQRTDLSLRSVQRHIRQTTGLTHAVIKQIERAHQAVALLEAGVTILDVVEHAGYADQPHLTRALGRFIGHSPARIVRESHW